MPRVQYKNHCGDSIGSDGMTHNPYPLEYNPEPRPALIALALFGLVLCVILSGFQPII